MAALRLDVFCCGDPGIMAWLEEHGLDPEQVCMNDDLSPLIDGDQMTVHLYRLDADGERYFDAVTEKVAVTARTVTLLRPPPDLQAVPAGRPATIPA